MRLKVNFCTRDNPFLLSIYLFTGGGFFGIALGSDGIELIEVSLEFGASISMDLGVASGGVSIMAGIYFSLAKNPSPIGPNAPADVVTLTGFLQASGNLEVLGIISISIVFYLGFTYQSPGKPELIAHPMQGPRSASSGVLICGSGTEFRSVRPLAVDMAATSLLS